MKASAGYRIAALFLALALTSSCGAPAADEASSAAPPPSVTNFSESSGAGPESSSSAASVGSSYSRAQDRDEPDAPPASEPPAESSISGAPEQTSLSESASPAAAEPAAGTRDSTPVVRMPSAPGTVVYGNGLVSIDCSNSASGYIMVKYTGSNGKVKLQITKSSTATYNLYAGYGYQAFPLSEGAGDYTVGVYENVSGTSYSQAYATVISASVANGTTPYLYPNQYVNYNSGSAAVAKGAELAAGASSDLGVVTNVYNWVISNITYDFAKANSVTSGYVPTVDSTLSTRTGICFDYAALMTAMLRTQNIPTKLVIGWSGSIYHAWISVYISGTGWLNDYIYFDGTSWKRMDPTFAAGGENSKSINDYINNGANYNALYFN